MPAQVAANLPFDPAPPPARAQASASGFQFLNMLAPPPSASTNHPSIASSSDGSGVAARMTTTASTPRATHSQDNTDGAARVMMVPVPPQPLPQPAGGTPPAGTTSASAGTLAAAPLPPVSSADAAALLLLAANALPGATAGATGAQPGAAGPAGAGTSPTNTTGAAGQSALPGQALPSMVASLSMRVASGAMTLVSQPSVTLASVAPAITAPAKPIGNEADLAALDRQSLLAEAARGSSKPGAAALAGGIDDALAAAAKDAAGTASQLVHDTPGTTDQNAATPAQTAGNADATNVPQIATMTPSPVTIANEMPPTLAMPPHIVAEQVAVTLRQAVSSGSDHIQIQLQPADLGAVEVKLSINHDGRVTMVVSADRSDTLNLLQQDASSLAQALRDAGLQADSSSLSFNLRGGYQFNQQQGAFAGPRLVDDVSAGGLDGIDTTTTTLRAHAGSLDIHV
jgi:flagellar hook-length control protein FliK